MTLDAGGTNFVFSAIKGGQEVVAPITLPSNGDTLSLCLETIVDGFKRVKAALAETPVAISFAFPGPADYPRGIIGDLANLPAFRGGVALGPMLQEKFGLPVFINNDGDLFAYGEAVAGLLPEINRKLSEAGSPKRYQNLVGVTLGTGFGGGIVRRGELFIGDNSAAGEIWVMRGKNPGHVFAEEGVSIRAVQRVYMDKLERKGDAPAPSPKEIHEIALGKADGDPVAARRAFEALGEQVGDSLANAVTLIDGLVVIGGGLAGAASLFLPKVIDELNGTLSSHSGGTVARLESKAFSLETEAGLADFLRGETREITVPGSATKLQYDPLKRVGVGLSRLGTSRATAIGAYAFALRQL